MDISKLAKPLSLISGILASFFIAFTVVAQEADSELSEEQIAYMQEIKEFWEGIEQITGEITLPGSFATLNVPDDYYYLSPEDTEQILVNVWGNPPGSETLGMLMPQIYTPFDQDSWAVTIEYVEDGYVSDEDANDINYDKMLKQMQKDTKASNKERESAGYGSVELLGWAESPFYSNSDKHLYWAKDLLFDGETRVLNYDIRTLGRKGVLSMTFIASTDQLGEVNGARDDVLNMVSFNEGFRYEDYEPGNDKLAAYGVGALVAGAAAKKAGLLAALFLLLKKFGVFIVIGIAAFGKKIKEMFSGKAQ